MEMHDLLKKISDLSVLEESKKETTHKGGTKSSDDGVTKHKGKYGTEYQGDEDDETEDGKKKKKAKDAEAPKRGRGRPRKDADSSTGQVAKYDNAKNLQSFMVGNIPKKGLPGKASKKHTLKDWIEAVDSGMLAEAQTTLKPGQVGITNPDGSTTVLQTRDTSPAGQATAKFIQAQANAGKIFGSPAANTAATSNTASSTNTASTSSAGGGVVASMSETDGERKTGKKLFKKPGVMVKGKKSVEEADVPNRGSTASPLTNTSREAPEKSSKKPASKSSKKSEWKNAFHEGKKAKPDFADIDDDGNEKETMKSAAKSAKAKKAVKEGHDMRQSAYHEGKCHAFENGHYRCRYDEGSEEHKHYHRGFVEGLEECYGGSMIEEGRDDHGGTGFDPYDTYIDRQNAGTPAAPSSKPAAPGSARDIARQMPGKGLPMRGDQFDSPLQRGMDKVRGFFKEDDLDEEAFLSELDALDEEYGDIEEMNKTQYMKAQARKTPGDTFRAFGQTMHDEDVLETDGMNELDIQMESWDRELKGLLTEGVTVSTSTGQKGMPDSVSISATDSDAHKLLQILSNAGMGISASAGAGNSSDYSDEQGSGSDVETGHEDVPAMARPRGFGMSQNVDSDDCEVIEPYDYDEISSALGSGGSAMSQLRTKLLALEAKGSGAMEMPDGMGFSVQHEEGEPQDTPEAPEPYDYEAVQGALEKGGAKAGAEKKSTSKKDSSKKSDSKKDDTEEDEKIEESDDHMARPRGFGVSQPVEEDEPQAPKKTEQKNFKNAKGQNHKNVRESAESKVEKTPSSVPFLGFSQFHDPDNSEEQVDPDVNEIDDVQDELEKHHSKHDEESKSDSKKHDDDYGNPEPADQEEALDGENLNQPDEGKKDKDSFASIYENFMKAINEDQMPMPKGNGFSVPGEAKEKMADGPVEVDVEDLDSVLSHLEEKDTYQQDEFEKAFSQLKKMIQSHSGSESKSETKKESSEDNDNDAEESIKEGSERCDECGAMYEGSHEDHTCEDSAEKLDEWANSMRGTKDPGQLSKESFMTDAEYMINTITGGLNGKKSDQTVNPHTRVKVAESDSLSDWIKLSGIR